MISKTTLTIDQLTLNVKLGLTKEERQVAQQISCSTEFYFPQVPGACITDQISDTICYHEIIEIIELYCQNSEFRLIEYLGYQLYLKIRENIPLEVKMKIKIDKQNGPVKHIQAASFSHSDL
jgi:dihydroneopterin aldolase